jgi:hypothetical protein
MEEKKKQDELRAGPSQNKRINSDDVGFWGESEKSRFRDMGWRDPAYPIECWIRCQDKEE